MDYEGSPEPIDFDFFDEGPRTERSERLNSPDQNKSARPRSGKRTVSSRGYDGDREYDRESVRSVTSSRSSVSVRIPTATPHEDDGNEADYYSDEFDETDEESDKEKEEAFRFKDDIGAFKKNEVNKATTSSSNHNGHGHARGGKPRPKTSKGSRQRSNSSSSNSSTHSASSSFTSESGSDHRSDNDSVTDVSPLQSPGSSPIPKLEYDEQEMEKEAERMRSVRFQEDDIDDAGDSIDGRRAKSSRSRPKSGKTRHHSGPARTPGYNEHKNDPRLQESEASELSALLRAVLELDETPTTSELSALHKNLKRPISGKRKNRPQSAPMPHQRMNMSFSNDDVRRIDRENKRLLEKIIARPNRGSTSSATSSRPASASRVTSTKPAPVSHSAVKRQREQRRIEIENRQILKRLQAARANPQLKKDDLLTDYDRQMQYASQVSKTPGGPPHRPASAKRAGTAYRSQGMSKASSMSSLGTEFSSTTTASSSTNRSRPRSAKWSGYEAARPEWDDRWHVN